MWKCPVLAIPNKFHEMQPFWYSFPTDYLVPYKRRSWNCLVPAKNFTTKRLLLLLFQNLTSVLSGKKIISSLVSCLGGNQCEEIQLKDMTLLAILSFMGKHQSISCQKLVNSRYLYLEHVLHTSKIEKWALAAKSHSWFYKIYPQIIIQNPRNEKKINSSQTGFFPEMRMMPSRTPVDLFLVVSVIFILNV